MAMEQDGRARRLQGEAQPPARASRARNSSSSKAFEATSSALAQTHHQPSSRRVSRQEGSSPTMGTRRSRERRERALELRRLAPGALDHAGAQIGAAAAIGRPRFSSAVHGIAGRVQHPRRRHRVLALERAVEGIDEQHHGLAACGPCLEHLVAARPRRPRGARARKYPTASAAARAAAEKPSSRSLEAPTPGSRSRRLAKRRCGSKPGRNRADGRPAGPSAYGRAAPCNGRGIRSSSSPCRRRWDIRACSPCRRRTDRAPSRIA